MCAEELHAGRCVVGAGGRRRRARPRRLARAPASRRRPGRRSGTGSARSRCRARRAPRSLRRLQPRVAEHVLGLVGPRLQVRSAASRLRSSTSSGSKLLVDVVGPRRLHRDRDRPVRERSRQLVAGRRSPSGSRRRTPSTSCDGGDAPPRLLALPVAAVQHLPDALGGVAVLLAEDGVDLVEEQRRAHLVDQPEQHRLGEVVGLDRVPGRQLEHVEQRRLPRARLGAVRVQVRRRPARSRRRTCARSRARSRPARRRRRRRSRFTSSRVWLSRSPR